MDGAFTSWHISLHVLQRPSTALRASPTVLSMWLQTVKFIEKKSKCAGLAQEIGFSAPNLCRLPWLVKGATQLCTSKKECNKLDLTATQYYWLVDHHDWSRDLLLVVPTSMQFQWKFYWWGCQKKKTAKLRHLILLSTVTYWAPTESISIPTAVKNNPFLLNLAAG